MLTLDIYMRNAKALAFGELDRPLLPVLIPGNTLRLHDPDFGSIDAKIWRRPWHSYTFCIGKICRLSGRNGRVVKRLWVLRYYEQCCCMVRIPAVQKL